MFLNINKSSAMKGTRIVTYMNVAYIVETTTDFHNEAITLSMKVSNGMAVDLSFPNKPTPTRSLGYEPLLVMFHRTDKTVLQKDGILNIPMAYMKCTVNNTSKTPSQVVTDPTLINKYTSFEIDLNNISFVELIQNNRITRLVINWFSPSKIAYNTTYAYQREMFDELKDHLYVYLGAHTLKNKKITLTLT